MTDTPSPSSASAVCPPPPPFQAGLVTIVGRANTGKSSLLNAILTEKVSAVSPVAQTTRRPVRGILTEERLQIVFLDTPGIRQATHTLGSLLNRTARGLVTGSDVVLLLLDAARSPQDEDLGWMKKLIREESPIFAILNKMDLGMRREAYEQAWRDVQEGALERDSDLTPPALRWFELSATTGEGIPSLLEALRHAMPEGAALYPDDVLTDDPTPFFIADVIRAQINSRLRKELPHAIAVATDQVKEVDGKRLVAATIYVEKASQRPIVIGNHAKMIRDIRQASERELFQIFGMRHKLELWVKVEPNWSRNYWMLKKFGYV
ncbi:MAG: GTPase Era [Verrucomicrobiota bacterium]|jgi:GTP-binding protein Era|nr:GTPase Era [Verrucomicrobiota bacterium]